MELTVGRTLVAGRAVGPALVLAEPLSLWGGLDPATGRVIDARHPQLGARVTGRVLVMPTGRGSSSSSSVLAEAIRAGTAPAAIVLGEPDAILVLGAVVARELYGRTCPVVAVDASALAGLPDARELEVEAGPDRAILRPASGPLGD
ncbi:MAG TPA: DUF126 domain-containing protein [Actinomycetota bacterium]|nr:DUF126 domain-containing protein [Actinomycetota bacterium]